MKAFPFQVHKPMTMTVHRISPHGHMASPPCSTNSSHSLTPALSQTLSASQNPRTIPAHKHQERKLASNEDRVPPRDQSQKVKISGQIYGQRKKILLSISSGKSVFFTGAAGTGKTNVLRHAVKILRRIHGDASVFVTASTGVAASALNGTTLQAFAGIGAGLDDVDSLVARVKRNPQARSRWTKAKALVIDEISMINGDLFDKLSRVGKIIRGQSREFGGLQLVVAGDFCQLPPVHPPDPDKFFAFQADCWDNCFDVQIELTSILRQTDLEFMNMLNEIRKGVCSPKSIRMLDRCRRPSLSNDADRDIAFTKLFPLKVEVVRENEEKLKELGQEIVTFHAEDSGPEHARAQIEGTLAVKELSLCVGAQVMLIYNLDTEKGLVNGKKGVVVGFESSDECNEISPAGVWPVVRFPRCKPEMVKPQAFEFRGFDKDGRVVVTAKRVQVPLILAWALSVHKCQGMTLERIETDLTRAFEYGMVYVALSRLKALEGLRLMGFHPAKVRAHPKVLEFYQRLGQNRSVRTLDRWRKGDRRSDVGS
uniref:ATP-dependent DNA helicase n=1 Tax=Wollemia nobilis TaxID=56998 RepID=A0A0C9S740_9CONI